MCGIVGYGGFTKRIRLDKAINAIHHRGPDDNGSIYFNGIALGNTRLAIIDLSRRGHQPMFNKDRSLCITFNGEIYNFQEIRDILEKKYQFTSHSDTEVVLYAYQEWGTRCLERLNGMFAFVIYDREKRLLFGARDRLGQKPLKYYVKNGRFIFASEIKAILSLLDAKPDIDEVAIDDFLTLQYVPSPKTGFKNIYKLSAGHYFIYQNKSLSIRKYWSVSFRRKLCISYEDWCGLIYTHLAKSVKSHMVSDVPVGAFLSGGLDSSLVVALMSKNSQQKVHTFSIGFDDQRFDETSYAKKISDLYGTNHRQIRVRSKDFLKYIERLAGFFDEPFADNSLFPMLLVSELASRHVKVALTGDGGDENFAGYDRYTFVHLRHILAKMPSSSISFARFIATNLYALKPNKFSDRARRFAASLEGEFYQKYILFNSFFLNQTKHSLYTNEFFQAVEHHDASIAYNKFFDPKLSDIDNALNLDIHTYLPDDLLYKSDTASMAYGLELRAPFLDHELIEKTAAMPLGLKIDMFGNKKKILKDIAFRYNLLPKDIISRPKQGFIVPVAKWLKGSLKNYAMETILSSPSMKKIFERDKVERYLMNYHVHDLPYDNNVFALFMLSLWLDAYQ